MNFTVSVIIPAYNVETFIATAVQSAVIQPEVTEVIVVDDGSTDSTKIIVTELQQGNPKIKIFQHEGGKNKGRSATRNLGIAKAQSNYIAFLDADDYYVANRFTHDKKVFAKNLDCDGVYNAVGFHFYRDANANELKKLKLSTISKILDPKDFFEAIVASKYGYLHLNGIVVKKTVFDVIGVLNESLVVAEDSEIIFKMALKCQMYPSVLDEPVAKRGIHDANIFTAEALYKIYNIKLYEELLYWSYRNAISVKNKDLLLKWLWFFKFRDGRSLLNHIGYWGRLGYKSPQFFLSSLGIKYFPIVRLRKNIFSFLYSNKTT
ncbi:glycosyltransferase family 2 protein [Flavobacterium faecale]|nr:glycosyltransferase family 2 protein [Flavobacterium faecale]